MTGVERAMQDLDVEFACASPEGKERIAKLFVALMMVGRKIGGDDDDVLGKDILKKIGDLAVALSWKLPRGWGAVIKTCRDAAESHGIEIMKFLRWTTAEVNRRAELAQAPAAPSLPPIEVVK